MLSQRLKHRAKRWVAAATAAAGLRAAGPAVPVLLYHSVAPDHPSAVPPERFVRQMEWLAAHFRVVPVGELAGLLGAEAVAGPGDRPLAALSFDDGFADNHRVALPVLLRLGLRASFFPCTDFVAGRGDITRGFRNYRGLPAMEPAALRELAAAGMELGAHGRSHIPLAGLSRAAQEQEILGSQAALADWLGQPVRSFAIPFGSADSFDDTTRAILDRHFTVACTTRIGRVRPADFPVAGCALLRRLEISPLDTGRDFAAKLRGDWDLLAGFQRRHHPGAAGFRQRAAGRERAP